jgi:hypothetical protein
MAWLGKIGRQFTQRYLPNGVMRYEFKFPERYRDTFIEKWGKCISVA